MAEPSMMTTKKWKEFLFVTWVKKISGLHGQKYQYDFHEFLGATSKIICQCFVSYVAFVKSDNGRNSQPETFPHRIVFMGMMSEIDIDRRTQKAEEHSRGDRGIVGWTERFRPGQLHFLFVACYVQFLTVFGTSSPGMFQMCTGQQDTP